MSLIPNSAFASKAYPFPPDDIDPKLKDNDPNWTKQWMEAMFSCFVRDETGFASNSQEKFDLLRLYGQGRQPTEKYKPQFSAQTNEADENAKGYSNIDFSIFSPMPKYKAFLRQRFEMLKHTPIPQALGREAGMEKEDAMWRSWMYNEEKDFLAAFDGQAGLNIPKPDFVPSSMEELMVMKEMGGFKTKVEIAMADMLQHTDLISGFDEIRRRIYDDLVDFSAAACRDYTDLETGKAKIKYVDPARLIMQYSLEHGFNNSRFAGFFTDYRLADIKVKLGLTDDQAMELAYSYCGYMNNPSQSAFDSYNVHYDNGKWGYDDFLVRVLEGEYLTVDSQYKIKKKNRYGNTRYYEDKFGEPIPFGKVIKGENAETHVTSVKVVRRGCWVVGTEHVFDYGLQYDIPRPNKSEAKLSFHAYKIPGKSIVETCMPNLDAIQNGWLKLQNANARSRPSGIAIEYTSLKNISFGKDEIHPLELLRITEQSGNLIYQSTTHAGKFAGTSAKPITELKGGAGAAFVEAIQYLEVNFNFISDVIGISRTSVGVLPSKETTATETRLADVGTQLVLGPLYTAYRSIKENLSSNLVQRGALLMKHNKKSQEYYRLAIGLSVEILTIASKYSTDQIGIKMTVMPDDQTKERIHMAALEAMKMGKEGHVGITMPDYLLITRMLEEGQVQYAEALLGERITRARKEHEQNAAQMVQLNGQQQQQLEQAKLQTEIMKGDAEHRRALELEEKKKLNELEVNRELHMQKMEQINAQNVGKLTNEVIKNGNDGQENSSAA